MSDEMSDRAAEAIFDLMIADAQARGIAPPPPAAGNTPADDCIAIASGDTIWSMTAAEWIEAAEAPPVLPADLRAELDDLLHALSIGAWETAEGHAAHVRRMLGEVE